MKVIKSAKHYAEAAKDEVDLLSVLTRNDPDGMHRRDYRIFVFILGLFCCVRMLDSFKHTGPNGTHICMVFETMGYNALHLIKAYHYKGLPIEGVKYICKQVCCYLFTKLCIMPGIDCTRFSAHEMPDNTHRSQTRERINVCI